MTYCKNCGKLLNPQTLICDACGTDYNETPKKPECEHIYDKVCFAADTLRCCDTLIFKCAMCGALLKVPLSDELTNFLRGVF